MKRYFGKRVNGLPDVRVNGTPLNPRLDLWKHNITGYEWGNGESGAAQLALALLADCLDEDRDAIGWHQDFMVNVVSGLPYDGWTLTPEKIKETITAFENA